MHEVQAEVLYRCHEVVVLTDDVCATTNATTICQQTQHTIKMLKEQEQIQIYYGDPCRTMAFQWTTVVLDGSYPVAKQQNIFVFGIHLHHRNKLTETPKEDE